MNSPDWNRSGKNLILDKKLLMGGEIRPSLFIEIQNKYIEKR